MDGFEFLSILGICFAIVYTIVKMIPERRESTKSKSRISEVERLINSPDFIKKQKRSDLSETAFQGNLERQIKNKKKKDIKILWVNDEHRNHPWSLKPGGTTVVVLYKDMSCFGYDKVKRPHRYMKKIIGENIYGVYDRDDNIHISTLQEYLSSIYVVREGEVFLNTVWMDSFNTSPWNELEKYATE